jgi:arylsulfatase A-like enzyme
VDGVWRALATAATLGAGLALLEITAILSQPGVARASLSDLLILTAWLAIPYGAALSLLGAAGAAVMALAGIPRTTAFVGTATAAGFLVWIRAFTRLGAAGPVHILLEALVAALCVAAGCACGLLARRLEGSREARGASRSAGRRWPRRLAASAGVVWVLFAAWDFSHLLSGGPIIAAGRAGAPPAAVPSGGGPNVLLISIDTLRADHLSCYGYPEVTSPSIDRLAAEGVRFARAASTASFTLPAHASMMTGLFPTSHGATYQNRDPSSLTVRGMGSGYPTLGEILMDHGYETAGFVSGPLLSHQFGFARGFMTYDDRYDRLQSARARLFARTLLYRGLAWRGVFSDRDLDSQRTADEMNPLVRRWLASRGRGAGPFFLFVHYWDPHGPYAPPPPLNRREDGSTRVVEYDMDRLLTGQYTMTPTALADTLALYDGEIRWVDRHVGELLDLLREAGTLDETLVILTSDHGESFGEHGHWEHSRVLYEDLLHVPFIMRLPAGRGAGTVVEDAVAQPTDILPTALSVAGLAVPEGVEGRDLTRFIGLAGSPAPDATTEGIRGPGLAFAELDRNMDWPRRWGAQFDRDLASARTLRWKYIQSSTGKEELFDLSHDPTESHDRSASDPEAAAAMRSALEAWRRSLARRGGEGEEIDEGLKENLRSLGYIQ